MFEAMTQFGVAGLMGMLWMWERTHSRKRERQLSQAHERLIEQDRDLAAITKLVRHNTRALVNFERTQQRMCEIMEGIGNEMSRYHRSA